MSPKELIPFIDYTTLNESDSDISVIDFIRKAKDLEIQPKSICTFSCFASILKKELLDSNVNACVVANAFPNGKMLHEVKVKEIYSLIEIGMDEVDVVLPRHLLQQPEIAIIQLKELVLASQSMMLKVIIESGELNDDEIAIACDICLKSKVDFIKTSTGKTKTGATINAVDIISTKIARHYKETNQKVGIKISGGIRDYKSSISFIDVIKKHLGEEWLTPTTFRIGASSLLNNLLDGSKTLESSY